jgi:hypothetical protein
MTAKGNSASVFSLSSLAAFANKPNILPLKPEEVFSSYVTFEASSISESKSLTELFNAL